jgi:hypothetical protein
LTGYCEHVKNSKITALDLRTFHCKNITKLCFLVGLSAHLLIYWLAYSSPGQCTQPQASWSTILDLTIWYWCVDIHWSNDWSPGSLPIDLLIHWTPDLNSVWPTALLVSPFWIIFPDLPSFHWSSDLLPIDLFYWVWSPAHQTSWFSDRPASLSTALLVSDWDILFARNSKIRVAFFWYLLFFWHGTLSARPDHEQINSLCTVWVKGGLAWQRALAKLMRTELYGIWLQVALEWLRQSGGNKRSKSGSERAYAIDVAFDITRRLVRWAARDIAGVTAADIARPWWSWFDNFRNTCNVSVPLSFAGQGWGGPGWNIVPANLCAS